MRIELLGPKLTKFIKRFSVLFNGLPLREAAIPIAPPSLTATVVSNSQIDLSWQIYSGNISGIIIERSTDGENFSALMTVLGARGYTDSDVGPDTRYFYRIRTYSSQGLSPYSNTVTKKLH